MNPSTGYQNWPLRITRTQGRKHCIHYRAKSGISYRMYGNASTKGSEQESMPRKGGIRSIFYTEESWLNYRELPNVDIMVVGDPDQVKKKEC